MYLVSCTLLLQVQYIAALFSVFHIPYVAYTGRFLLCMLQTDAELGKEIEQKFNDMQKKN